MICRSLLLQLQQNPQLLSPNIQIFIPTEYRTCRYKRNKYTINPNSNNPTAINNSSKNQINKLSSNINLHTWLPPNKEQCNNNNIDKSFEQLIWNELKNKQLEIDKLKEDFDIRIQNLQSKYNNNVNKLRSMLI